MQPLTYDRSHVQRALELLRIERLVLAIHDASYPSLPEEDLGRGSPYSLGGRAFLRFVHELGFNAVQFGPQGQTSRINPSPYDGTVFSRNLLSWAPGPLVAAGNGLVSRSHLERLVRGAPVQQGGAHRNRVDYAYAYNANLGLLEGAFGVWDQAGPDTEDLRRQFQVFVAENLWPGSWLERDALYSVLSATYGTDDWRLWPAHEQRLYRTSAGGAELSRRRIQSWLATATRAIEVYALGQFLLQTQHNLLRQEAGELGLNLFGDLQVGYAHQDLWAYGDAFLANYRMGAPPSRTNPEGQAWGYPALDPDRYETPEGQRGLATELLASRVGKLLNDFDGLRIDHPHGLVCPWVYRIEDPRPDAVQRGARLFASPHLPDHPELAKWALVTGDQINPIAGTPRHADDWVVELSPQQVQRYAVALDVVIAEAAARGLGDGSILCEVLSTWPRPLRDVMQERRLGRFCVTQKTRPEEPNDVYRSDRLSPLDWIMVGNHDTPPLQAMLASWQGTPQLERRAWHLAELLVREPEARASFAHQLVNDPKALANAMFAELFASPAANVSIFFADLFGLSETYNKPGVHDELNWTLRVPSDYAQVYPQRARQGYALDLRRALAVALRAKVPSAEGFALADVLEREAGPFIP